MSNDVYFVEKGDVREGPLDLLTVMRRIRSGKVRPNTSIYVNDAEHAVRAERVPELEPFFLRLLEGPKDARASTQLITLSEALRSGWRFTLENHIMTVYAGGLMLMGMMIGIVMINLFGTLLGSALGWCAFMLLHHFYLIFLLRFCRGQTTGSDFINMQLAPVLGSLIVGTTLYAILVATGLVLLIIPGLLLASWFIFLPFILIDRQCNLLEAFRHSSHLMRKAGPKALLPLTLLMGMHFLAITMLVPVPLTLPIFAAALCDIYEKISA